jgi:nitrile hydratase subunit beta
VNGVHDLGGMHGFGPVVREENEPVFHEEWERRAFALVESAFSWRRFNTDEFRRTIERMPPARYLAASYYERWLYAIESLLIEKGVVTREEIDATAVKLQRGEPAAREPSAAQSPAQDGSQATDLGSQPAGPSRRGAPKLRFDPSFKPRFKAGQRVIARNINPEGHTRIPRYARGRRGVIHQDWGVFVFPDTHAHGQGANPQHCYSVEFGARELWGADYPENERVLVDLWDDYLEIDRAAPAGGTRRGGLKKALGPKRTARTVKAKASTAGRVKKAPVKGRRAAGPAGVKSAGRRAKKNAKRPRKSR